MANGEKINKISGVQQNHEYSNNAHKANVGQKTDSTLNTIPMVKPAAVKTNNLRLLINTSEPKTPEDRIIKYLQNGKIEVNRKTIFGIIPTNKYELVYHPSCDQMGCEKLGYIKNYLLQGYIPDGSIKKLNGLENNIIDNFDNCSTDEFGFDKMGLLIPHELMEKNPKISAEIKKHLK